MAMTGDPRPTTWTGVSLSVVVPSPNCPYVLFPQHCTPPLTRAHVWWCPAAITVTPDVSPTTSTGLLRSVVVPSPSCPSELDPQHFTPPPVVRAHVWYCPADTIETFEDSPGTVTGMFCSCVFPMPSWPYVLSP